MNSTILAVLLLLVGVAWVRSCDTTEMERCISVFRMEFSKANDKEKASEKRPESCKSVAKYIMCSHPTIANCTTERMKHYATTVELYNAKPYNCDHKVHKPNGNHKPNGAAFASLSIVSMAIALLIAARFN